MGPNLLRAKAELGSNARRVVLTETRMVKRDKNIEKDPFCTCLYHGLPDFIESFFGVCCFTMTIFADTVILCRNLVGPLAPAVIWPSVSDVSGP